MKHKKIVESEHRRWFWLGLHKTFRKNVEEYMRIRDPNLNDSEPFKIEVIEAGAEKMYNRLWFDEDEMLVHLGESDEEDRETESESNSGSDSSDEDSDQESESEEEVELSLKRARKKKATPAKKGANKSTSKSKGKVVEKPSKRSSGSGIEEGTKKTRPTNIDDLVTGMRGLNLSDPAVLSLWVQLTKMAAEGVASKERSPPRSNMERDERDRGRRDDQQRDASSGNRNNTGDRNGPFRSFNTNSVCYGCGESGHIASRCEEINKFIQDGIIARNGLGRVQWKDGSKISRNENESILDAVKRMSKKANVVFRTYEDDSSGGEDGNYTYLSTQRFDSDAESEEQEEIWLNSVTSGVFEVEAYPVQRVPKVSRSTRAGGSKTGNVPVVTNPAFDRTRKVKFEEMRPRKGSVDMDVKSDMLNARNGTDRRIPVDVHENVFDGNVDHDLVPMEVEDTGGKDDGGKKDKPVGGKSNRDTREVTKVRPDAVKTSIQLSGQIMKSTHTVALETLLEISPQLRRALGSAVRGTNGNPSPESRKENESKTFAAVPDDGDEAPWGQAPITRQMVADNERDNLLKIKVHVGDVAIMAIIDTGSQANLISERAYSASGLMRTNENIMPMVGAFGGHGVCIGKLEWVPLYITAGKVLTWGSKIGVLRNPPFDMILGQTWLTGNKVSIEQRPEGVYLSLIYKNKKVLVNVCPNSRYL